MYEADFKILCTNSLFKKKLLALCVAQKHLIIKTSLTFQSFSLFDLSTKYQLDECALRQEYNIVPDQIHPCARIDVHQR